jgi:sigma-B regulation protein RsbU (phosphoserine phosphatase)
MIAGREDIFGNQKFVLGRMFIPVSNASSAQNTYFAFDTYLNFQSIFKPNVLGKAFLSLLVLFLLFNSLVIRQVGKFGAQINKIIIQKFAQLREGIQQIARGNLDYKFNMEGEDEFVELADHFNEMSVKLKSTIEQAREKDRLDHELKIARQVQISLLPVQLPEIPNFNIAASLKTANEIGGDFYDMVPVGDDKYLFTIGDVSGKGSSAAFYMAQYISLLRYSRQFTINPDDIAIRINKYFSTQIVDRQIFITAIVGILNLKNYEINFVRAGHNLPILIPGNSNQDLQDIESKGIGIGLTKSESTFKKKIELKKISLEPGDLIVFYTDGVVEAAHPPDKDAEKTAFIEYGEQRFKVLLKQFQGINAEELVRICNEDLDSFYQDHLRIDDHTLFFLQRSKDL